MITRACALTALVLALGAAAAAVPTTARADTASVTCHLRFNISGWSFIYKHAEGTGWVRCDNGQSARVAIEIVGGGLTAGKYKITNGTGEISTVNGIRDVFGDYAQAGVEAGLVKSANAQVLTKGTTSLALAGTGEGINIGVSGGRFTIRPH